MPGWGAEVGNIASFKVGGRQRYRGSVQLHGLPIIVCNGGGSAGGRARVAAAPDVAQDLVEGGARWLIAAVYLDGAGGGDAPLEAVAWLEVQGFADRTRDGRSATT